MQPQYGEAMARETLQIGAGLSTNADPLTAGTVAARKAAGALGGGAADAAMVFASGTNLATPEAALEGVQSVLEPATLVGCGAGGVLGPGRELESGSAVAVWAARFAGGEAHPFHVLAGTSANGGDAVGLPDLEGSTGAIVLSDPYSFPTETVLERLAREAPGMPILGGIASARTPEGEGALFLGDRVHEVGAVGLVFADVALVPCVSQGAAPVGREVTITAADGNLIHELAGCPALSTVEQIVDELGPRERTLLAGGLLIGIVVDGGKPEYGRGDFLVRGVLEADPETGSIAVGAGVKVGQVVRLHARDASSADEDLSATLRTQVRRMGSDPAGALVFCCNGRGTAMFGVRDHDAATVERELRGAPAAGFFAAGEIGPVGPRSFLHGFTATMAVFPR
jgi:small ligand-binding sensory domain FIST